MAKTSPDAKALSKKMYDYVLMNGSSFLKLDEEGIEKLLTSYGDSRAEEARKNAQAAADAEHGRWLKGNAEAFRHHHYSEIYQEVLRDVTETVKNLKPKK